MHTTLAHLGRKHIGGAFAPQGTPMIRKIKCLILTAIQWTTTPWPRLNSERKLGYLALSSRGHVGCAGVPIPVVLSWQTHLFSSEHTFRWWFRHTPFLDMNVSCLAFQVVAIKIQTLARMPSPSFNFTSRQCYYSSLWQFHKFIGVKCAYIMQENWFRDGISGQNEKTRHVVYTHLR
jgi:hypothetical protein